MSVRDRKVFVSISTYLLGKELGIEAASTEVTRQLNEVRDGVGGRPLLPCVKTIKRLQSLCDDVFLAHRWSSDLPKLRSRDAHDAWESERDLWVTCDDDVTCDTSTLLMMLELAHNSRGIACLPCIIRDLGAPRLNVIFEGSIVLPTVAGPARALMYGGTGLMVVSKPALQRMHDAFREAQAWDDDDGESKVALFEQRRVNRKWWGEDYSFCQRARELGIDILAPARGFSWHDGKPLDLGQIDVQP